MTAEANFQRRFEIATYIYERRNNDECVRDVLTQIFNAVVTRDHLVIPPENREALLRRFVDRHFATVRTTYIVSIDVAVLGRMKSWELKTLSIATTIGIPSFIRFPMFRSQIRLIRELIRDELNHNFVEEHWDEEIRGYLS